MANSFFDWTASLTRFVRFDAARAEEVNAALDEVSAGFDDVEVKTNAAFKGPNGESNSAIPSKASRINKVMTFDASGDPVTTYTIADVATVSGIAADVTTVAGISGNVTTVATNDANVTTVAGGIANVNAVGGSIANVNTVATNIASVNTAATNIAAIIDAPTQASNAAASANAAAASFDSFDDRYLGAKAADPTLDNDGNALLTGALYWNSVANQMRAYSGSAWEAAYLPAVGYLETGDIGSTVQGYDADTAKLDEAQSWTGQQTFAEVKDTVYTITDGAAFEIDPANGSVQTITLTASRTPAATNFEAGQTVLLGIDDGTEYSITWTTVAPVWVKAGGTGVAPTLATTGWTWVLLWKVGSVMYAAEVGSP